MNRIPTLHALTAGLLGLALAAGAVLPAAAAGQDAAERRADRRDRRAQNSEAAASEAPRPAQADRRSEHNDSPERFERAVIPATTRSGNDAERQQNRGDLARWQRERQATQEPRGPWQQPERVERQVEQQREPEPRIAGQREARRAQWEDRQAEQRQRIAELRDRRQESVEREATVAGSPQARVIAEARQQEARRDVDRDWRDDHRRNDRRDWREGDRDGRLSREQARHRIEEQRRQQAQWRRDDDRRRAEYDRHRHNLERQRRDAQYRYQQEYWRRWLAAQARWNNHRYDYDRDPFFYTPYNYRYSYGGRWYSTNSYGAEILRQAVRDGYREGWYAGQADRMDRWQFDYRNNYGWIDGSYGYSGRYVSHNDYRWYFRQGFERGYRDGYYGRYQYGRYDRDGAMILPAILGMILGFAID